MKNAIKEFICLSEDEKRQLWGTAVFVFDTNVLLDLYRYSNNTRETLIKAISSLKERVYLPYHIAYEFMNNRFEVILESVMKYSALEKDMQNFIEKLKTTLRLEDNDENLDGLKKCIKEWLNEREDNDLTVNNPQEDSILDIVLDMFDKKVGPKYTNEEYQTMCDEGKQRYDKKIPPGYDDINKPENKYGDYIIWSDILKYSKNSKNDIIFITRDLKDDWWLTIKGRKICPHIRMNREFIEQTKQRFYMYSVKSFLEQFNGENDGEKEKAISEIEKISNENVNQQKFNNNGIEYQIHRIEAKIGYINGKMSREEHYITNLINKYPYEPRPSDIQSLIDNTRTKMNEFEIELFNLHKQLAYLQKDDAMKDFF